jgi:selenium metabolism protein YedF
MTKRAIEEGGFELLEVLVDGEAARGNVLRYAAYAGLEATVAREEGAATAIGIRASAREADAAEDAVPKPSPSPLPSTETAAGATVLLSSCVLGRGDEELGALLMRGFTYALAEAETPPERVILMNSALRLATDGSDCLANLRKIAERGVDILACGTCLEFLGLKDRLAVGRVSNMYEIAALLMAGRTLSL